MYRLAIFASIVLAGPTLVVAQSPSDSCTKCHLALESEKAGPAQKFATDVHHDVGLSCADCHGGDPHEESMEAMSPAKGFRGAPKKPQIPQFCARCHSDTTFMHRFDPRVRVDQLSQYLTSVHGKRLKQGDTKVAACVDCHGVHDILRVSDTRSPVYPMNVATTCAHCHADAEHMKGYGIPTDQVENYEKSVHAQMLAQGDTSAPTCTTCHGNHGATPPGVRSVVNVCGTCHVFFEQLFNNSPHRPVFAAMGLPGCVQCHSNHAVVKPSDDWVGTGPNSVCMGCHAEGDKGFEASRKIAGDLAKLQTELARAGETLSTAEHSGMEVSTPKVGLTNANEALVKARVNVHTFNEADVRKFTDQGVEISQKAYQAGVAALHERDARRKGLGVSLIFIVLTISGLYLKIRLMESRPSPSSGPQASGE
ncbi:MAG: cytochrome c3 family protein [Acidobacteria bacterium]|nr:cytochrome c3 family protein [Acidobacteriota bacterium]